mmetsp:Transcript_20380/g.59081  ORF Transcript_20380/g.59081 Transcript_20380/m.59081 type:complete len:281 (+) Transcript_20380:181-1023(+)
MSDQASMTTHCAPDAGPPPSPPDEASREAAPGVPLRRTGALSCAVDASRTPSVNSIESCWTLSRSRMADGRHFSRPKSRLLKGPSMISQRRSTSSNAASFNAWVFTSDGSATLCACSRARANENDRSRTCREGKAVSAASLPASTSAAFKSCVTRSKTPPFCVGSTFGSRARSPPRPMRSHNFFCKVNTSSLRLAMHCKCLARKPACCCFASSRAAARGVRCSASEASDFGRPRSLSRGDLSLSSAFASWSSSFSFSPEASLPPAPSSVDAVVVEPSPAA